MKNFITFLKPSTNRILFMFFFSLAGLMVHADQIDIGIFESIYPDNTIEIQIKIRPDFEITNEIITNIVYTVGWLEPSPPLGMTVNYISPYFMSPMNYAMISGYHYQVFVGVPLSGNPISANEEVLVSTLLFTNGQCPYFEINNNAIAQLLGGGLYIELNGVNKTGIIYASPAQSQTVGGSVTGGSTINLGENTGTLTLVDYSGIVLKWQKRLDSGSWTDIANTNGTYSEQPSSTGDWDYRAIVKKGTCTADTSASTQVHVNGSTQWTGNTDNDWSTSGNWTYGTPTQYLEAVVPLVSGKPYPRIYDDGFCNDLNIGSGARVTIDATGTLTVSGTLTNNAGESGFIIESSAAGTGSLISSTQNVDASVKRFLTKMKWHFIGMPVESAVAGVFHLSSGHSDIWLRPHVELTNTWGEEIIPVDSVLVLGKGYECWVGDDSYNNNETVTFHGQLNAGDFTTGSGGFYGLTYTGTGYNFISNPYPSALQGNIHSWSKTNVDNSIWVWQGTGTGMGGGGNYLTWNGTTGSLTGGIIPAMQGFFVHANNSGASLTLPQSSRTHSSQLYYKDSGLPLNTLRVNVTGNSCFDAVFIGFNDFASEEYDSEYDVVKMYGISQAPQLYSIIPGNELSINILPAIGDDRIVPIGFECEVPSTFKLETIGMDGFEPNTEFYLEDMKEGIIQNMEDNPVYIFTNESGDEAERFRLHFGMPNSITESSLDKVQIYSFDNLIHIRNPNMEKIQVYVYDIVGRLILSDDYNGVSLIKINTHVETGYYVVKVLSGGEVTQKKIFLK